MPCSAGVAWRRSGPLRKALEVIEARCSDDISSPPRCRPIPPTLAEIRSLRSRIEGEERLRLYYPPRPLRGDVSIVWLYVRTSVCVCVFVINVCARERLHRVRSIGSPVAHPGMLLLRNYVISRISLSPNRLRI